MQSRYVYITLSNEGRLNKLKCQKRKRKRDYQIYSKLRQQMDWRLNQFSKRLGYGSLLDIDLMKVQETVRQKFIEDREELRRFWGGGKYFKKRGRMDKVKYKQSHCPEGHNFEKRGLTQIFHYFQTKLNKSGIQVAFTSILNNNKNKKLN